MQNTYDNRSDLSVSEIAARREFASELAECKKALRKNDLDRDTARYIATQALMLQNIIAQA